MVAQANQLPQQVLAAAALIDDGKALAAPPRCAALEGQVSGKPPDTWPFSLRRNGNGRRTGRLSGGYKAIVCPE